MYNCFWPKAKNDELSAIFSLSWSSNGGMHNEDVPSGSNVIPILVPRNVIEYANFENPCGFVEFGNYE